jgi:hypothetical protein
MFQPKFRSSVTQTADFNILNPYTDDLYETLFKFFPKNVYFDIYPFDTHTSVGVVYYDISKEDAQSSLESTFNLLIEAGYELAPHWTDSDTVKMF